MQSELTIALAGNPNSGKTTAFNSLTGSHQHVGNYPGITVEKKEGYIRLLWRVVLIVAVGWLLFTQVFLIGQAPDNEMFPAVEAGDLLIGYRLEQNLD